MSLQEMQNELEAALGRHVQSPPLSEAIILEYGEFYVQFGWLMGDSRIMVLEAVSNNFLPRNLYLTRAQEAELLRLGFNPPNTLGQSLLRQPNLAEGEELHPNWWVSVQVDDWPLFDLARLAIDTMMKVYHAHPDGVRIAIG